MFRGKIGKQLAFVVGKTTADSLRESSQLTRAGEHLAIGSKNAFAKEAAEIECGSVGGDSGRSVAAGLVVTESESDLVGDLASCHRLGHSGGAGGQESSRSSSDEGLHFE